MDGSPRSALGVGCGSHRALPEGAGGPVSLSLPVSTGSPGPKRLWLCPAAAHAGALWQVLRGRWRLHGSRHGRPRTRYISCSTRTGCGGGAPVSYLHGPDGHHTHTKQEDAQRHLGEGHHQGKLQPEKTPESGPQAPGPVSPVHQLGSTAQRQSHPGWERPEPWRRLSHQSRPTQSWKPLKLRAYQTHRLPRPQFSAMCYVPRAPLSVRTRGSCG